MLIRKGQIKAMDDAMALEYCRRLMSFYRRRAPQLVSRFDDNQLQQRISAAVSKARSWELTSGESIAQYVALALTAGPKFDEAPKVRTFMGPSGSAPDLKMRRLLQLVAMKLSGSRKPAGSRI
jgi:hypothetical protein